jgi:hypothetical protein
LKPPVFTGGEVNPGRGTSGEEHSSRARIDSSEARRDRPAVISAAWEKTTANTC